MAEHGTRELDRYLGGLPFRVRRQLVEAIRQQADRVADAIRAAAPIKTGNLRNSVQVSRGRNTLELIVTAGGAETTREVRAGSGASYDYALGVEFGNEHAPAQPFFNFTWRDMQDDVRRQIEAAVDEALKQ